MKKYNSIDGRIHTNSRLWYFIRMAIKKMEKRRKGAEKEIWLIYHCVSCCIYHLCLSAF